MKQVSSIIKGLKLDESGNTIDRIVYAPYSQQIAKRVWRTIAESIIKKEIVINDNLALVWSNLIKYAHADDDCIFDISKPLYLVGSTGSTKTSSMKILSKYMEIDDIKIYRNNKLASFRFKIFTARNICADYEVGGSDALMMYKTYGNICIDDLGTEPNIVNHFGSKLDVISEIIEERNAKELITHFTTNLTRDDLKARYGDRCYSRILGSCNVIKLTSIDNRLNK